MVRLFDRDIALSFESAAGRLEREVEKRKTPRRTGRAGLVVDEVSRLNGQDAKPLPHVVRQQHIDIARDWCVIGEALYAEGEGVVKCEREKRWAMRVGPAEECSRPPLGVI